MRRLLGTLAINWLRKPENQAKLKRGANEARRRFDEFRGRQAAKRGQAAPPPRDGGPRGGGSNTQR